MFREMMASGFVRNNNRAMDLEAEDEECSSVSHLGLDSRVIMVAAFSNETTTIVSSMRIDVSPTTKHVRAYTMFR